MLQFYIYQKKKKKKKKKSLLPDLMFMVFKGREGIVTGLASSVSQMKHKV